MRTSNVSLASLFVLILCSSIAGCGGDDDDPAPVDGGFSNAEGGALPDFGPREDSGPPEDSGPREDGGPREDAGARDDAATPVDAGASDAGPPVDGGPSSRSATLSEFVPFGNCIPGPGGGGDRLIATWTVRFENTGSAPYTASVTAASMTVTIASAVTEHTITTTTESLPELLPVTEIIVPVGGASFQLRITTITPSSGACGAAFCADGKATVSLTLLLGDVSVMLDSADEMTFCAM